MRDSGAGVLIKTIIGSLSDDELMELAKPIDEVDIDRLPAIKKIFGLNEEDKYGK